MIEKMGNDHQSELEQYRGIPVPIYVLCQDKDFISQTPVLGIVDTQQFRVKERSAREQLRQIAHQHFLANRTHTIYSLCVIIKHPRNPDQPDDWVMLNDSFRLR